MVSSLAFRGAVVASATAFGPSRQAIIVSVVPTVVFVVRNALRVSIIHSLAIVSSLAFRGAVVIFAAALGPGWQAIVVSVVPTVVFVVRNALRVSIIHSLAIVSSLAFRGAVVISAAALGPGRQALFLIVTIHFLGSNRSGNQRQNKDRLHDVWKEIRK
jgi:hypothetical protein